MVDSDDHMYLIKCIWTKDKDLTKNNLYWIIYQFNERKMKPVKFYLILLNEIYQLHAGNVPDTVC